MTRRLVLVSQVSMADKRSAADEASTAAEASRVCRRPLDVAKLRHCLAKCATMLAFLEPIRNQAQYDAAPAKDNPGLTESPNRRLQWVNSLSPLTQVVVPLSRLT